jgi:hypothetical protein
MIVDVELVRACILMGSKVNGFWSTTLPAANDAGGFADAAGSDKEVTCQLKGGTRG